MIQENKQSNNDEKAPEFTPQMANALLVKILVDVKGVSVSRKGLESIDCKKHKIHAVYHEEDDTFHIFVPRKRVRKKIVTPKLIIPR